jgi:hypothetical protein
MLSCKKRTEEIDPVVGTYIGVVESGSSDYKYTELPDGLANARVELIDISRLSSNPNSDVALRGLSGYRYELIITNINTNKRFLYSIGLDRNGGSLNGRYQTHALSDYASSKFSVQPLGSVSGNSLTLSLKAESFQDGTL